MARTSKKETALTPEEKLARALVPEAEQPYQVPENWCWTKMSIVAQWGSGGTPSRKNPDYYEGSIPWIKTGELNDDYVYETEEHITENAILNSSAKLFPVNTIAIAMYGATIGKVSILGVEATTNQACACGVSTSALLYKYLFYYARSQKDAFIGKAKGGAQPNISQDIIKNHTIPLPPLAEQQRIVDRIESLFAKLDEAKEKAQAVVDGYEDRKAAILHKAFSGDLTAEWRKENNKTKNEWFECNLISVLTEKPRNGYSPTPVNYETKIKSMTLSATTSGVFRPEFYKYIDEEIPDDSYLWLKPGDILIQRANSLEKVGTSAIYDGENHVFIYPDLMMKLKVSDLVEAEYVAYYLKTERVLQYLRSNATGTAGNMPKINQKVVSNIPFAFSPKAEQREIIRILKVLLSKQEKAKEAAEQVIDQIDTMKKAILARAFRGELGTNDPADESAEELLKRVL